jgi:hypothetical protein
VHKMVEVEQTSDESMPHSPYKTDDIESLGYTDEKRHPGTAF